MTIPKSCSTCEHRESHGEFARCSAYGYFCSIARRQCGKEYEAWTPRIGVFQRIKLFFTGVKNE